MENLKLFGETFVELFVEMAPFLLLGFLIAGVLHVWVPRSLYVPKICKSNFKSVFISSLVGIPLPICSCGVIPTAVSLRKEGASKGSAVSFLISTPAMGVDSILATFSLLGQPFAILRPVAAFITALIGGTITNIFCKNDDVSNNPLEVSKENHQDCCHGSHKEHDTNKCCCHETKNEKVEEHHDHCCCKKEEKHEEHSCGCCHEKIENCGEENSSNHSLSFAQKLKKTFDYGFGELLAEISKWLLIGLVLGALIAAFVPDELFMNLREYPLLCMLAVLLVSMPMYTCSTGSIPLALALMDKGLPPGAAFVLLMAGPATSFASMVVIGKTFGKKTLAIYLLSIGLSALLVGYIVDTFFMDVFLGSIVKGSAEEIAHSLSALDFAFAGILAILMLRKILFKKKGECGCGKC